MKKTIKIDFLGIGAEKAATTWLFNCLKQHPEISMPAEKEIFFFNEVDPHFLKIKNLRYKKGIRWYLKKFDKQDGRVKGEISPTYLYSKVAARRIAKHFPNIKLIVILRNPSDRAFSQYIHDKRLGVISEMDFDSALEKYPNYIEKGKYLKYLKIYERFFDRKNILIILFDDIKKNPKKVVKSVFDFLNLYQKDIKIKNINKKVNKAQTPRFSFLNYLMIQFEYFLRKKNLFPALYFLDSIGVRKFAKKIRDLNSSEAKNYPKINTQTKAKLLDIYKVEIDKLEKYLNKDLSSWKKI